MGRFSTMIWLKYGYRLKQIAFFSKMFHMSSTWIVYLYLVVFIIFVTKGWNLIKMKNLTNELMYSFIMLTYIYNFNVFKLYYFFNKYSFFRTHHGKEMSIKLYIDMEVATSTTANPHWKKRRTISQTTQKR